MSTMTRGRTLFRHPRPESVRSKPRGVRVFDRLEERLVMSSFTVTDNSDLVNDTGSLRYAITQVDAGTDASNTITIDPTLTGGQTITLTSALPQIIQNVTIAGPVGSVVSVSGAGQFRVFNIAAGSTVAISGLTVVGGKANGGGGNYGGGIDNAGTLMLTGSTIASNSATYGGGGIFNDYSGALTVIDSTIDSNSAFDGGGIGNLGTMTVNNSTIASNSVTDGGGGLFNYPGGALTVTNSTIASNSADGLGGGIYNDGIDGSPVTLTVANSTLASNSAGAGGGGIANASGTLTLTDSTLASNSAYEGGGIWDDYFDAGLPRGWVDNTIIAGNTSAGGNAPDAYGSFNSLGNNLLGAIFSSFGLLTGTDLAGTPDSPLDPKLGPLADNGGPTRTMALLAGSPAIDAGNNALAVDPTTNQPLTYDQRGAGFLRVLGSAVDIGSSEFAAPLSTSNLQTAISSLPPNVPLTIAAMSTDSLANVLGTISALPPTSTGMISVALSGTTYQNQDSGGNVIPFTASAPSGMTLTISCPSGSATVYDLQPSGGNIDVHGSPQGDITLIGKSPALTVTAGHVTIGPGVTLTTATNSPTILVSGGSLTVRGSTIQESTGYAQDAILITGGTADLGTAADPGGNTINVNGYGLLICDASASPVSAVGDTFELNGTPLTDPYRIEDAISDALKTNGAGLVTFVPGNVYVTATTGSIQRGVDAVASGGTVNVEGSSYPAYYAGAKPVTVAFQDGPTLAQNPDPIYPGTTELVVTGAPTDNLIGFDRGAVAGSIDVFVNFLPVGSFTPTGRLVAHGGSGNNTIAVSPRVSSPAWLFAGLGNGLLAGGGGNNVLVGGGGNVVLVGGLGRNVMIGGRGTATFMGGPGQDLMIGGSTAYDANEAALAAVLAEWTRNVTLSQRVSDLSQGVMANGSVVKIDGTTVISAPVADELFGGGGADWFLVNPELDTIHGKKKGSIFTSV